MKSSTSPQQHCGNTGCEWPLAAGWRNSLFC